MPDASPAVAAPRRRWRPRLSLRATMVLVLVVGAPLGWVARRAAIQRRAVARVQALGGTVAYADQRDAQGFFTGPRNHRGPAWLRRLIGDEPFQEVAEVEFDAPEGSYRVDDGSIGILNDFERLESLRFNGLKVPEDSPHRPVTAAGLAKLSGLGRLRILGFYHVNVDEATMRVLSQWPCLEVLAVITGRDPLPAASLRVLGDLPRLKHVDLQRVGPSGGDDLAPLARLAHLELVSIVPSPRSGAGLEKLAAPSLERLVLRETELTEASLAALARLPNLAMLHCDGGRLARGSLRALAGARRLNDLNIGRAGREDVGVFDAFRDGEPRLGDEDLDALRDVPLRSLMASGLDATDAGVARFLDAHAGLRSIHLGGRDVTDASAAKLAAHGRLAGLILRDTAITDAGLGQLAAAPTLILVTLVDNARLTPEGVAALRGFPKLRYLTLRQPGVTPAMLDAIRAAHPGIRLEQLPDARR